MFTMGAGDVYKLKDQIIKIINNKSRVIKLQIQKNKDISHFLTLRNHVKVEYFLEAKSREDLIEAKKYSIKNKVSLFVLGGGSNLAIVRNNLKGLIVKNNYIDIKILRENKNNAVISVSSGYPVGH